MLFKSPFVAMLIASHLILTGCDNSQKPTDKPISPAPVPIEKPKPTDEVLFLDQGLSEDDRLTFYYLSQGSQLLPYFWFLALEKSDDQTLFRSANNMRALGFIPQAEDPGMNPDGLPIGFVKNDDPATVSYAIKKEFLGPDYDTGKYPPTNTWLGFTCANCHTFEISYEGRKIRIDGSSSHADHQAFLEQLIDALQATTRSADKMSRFAHRALDPNWNQGEQDALKQRVEAYTPILEKLRDQNKTELRYGHGRLDAFGAIFNRVLETGLEIPGNHVLSDAPVSYPFLWDTPRLDWVQYNSLAGNPIARNVGEVLGVYGHLQLLGTPETGQFNSTIRLQNLDRLEGYVAQLKAPPWPAEVLGNIDFDKAAIGQQLYEQNCVQCHSIRDENGNFPMTTENKGGVQFIKTHSNMPLPELGTDSKMVQNALQYKADPGVLRPLLPEEFQNLEKVPRVVILQAAVQGVIKRKLSETGVQGDALKELVFRLSGQRTDPLVKPPSSILATYRARPLNGIWATAPFLHNGSVPNLYQLLLPVEQRVKTFHVGSNQFDPLKVGFVIDQGFEFNATLPGNLNSGHSGPQFTQLKTGEGAYRDFTDEERMALIEYMKTLI
ncbi:MAG: cytochrome C [Desulfobulbaceae bacterium]|nr:cytochrome C [Desulfobulbaceae bacterium]